MALRRNRKDDQGSWRLLPSEGRKGNAPAWPLQKWRELEKQKPAEDRDDATARAIDARELSTWRTIWKTPQAVAWDQLGWRHDVALYVRLLVASEAGSLKAASEVRQWSNLLGLNPSAMLRNRWRIATDQVAEKRQENTKKDGARRPSSKDRLHVVRNGTGF